jgi:hypothetical protein
MRLCHATVGGKTTGGAVVGASTTTVPGELSDGAVATKPPEAGWNPASCMNHASCGMHGKTGRVAELKSKP